MAALEQLEPAYDALRQDPVFWAELRELLGAVRRPPDRRSTAPTAWPRPCGSRRPGWRGRGARRAPTPRRAVDPRTPPVPQARGPRPHRRAQDQQRARPVAAHAPARQDRGSSPRPAPASTASRRPPPARCSTCRASSTWAPRTSSARGRTCCGCARSAPRSARSPRARPRSRTRSTRRCATGSRTSRRPTTCSARRWARIRTRRSSATSSAGSATRPRPSSRPSRAACRTLALACVGGGSNAIGLLARFIGEPSVRLAVVEAAGDGIETGRHAAAILGGTPGILHGSRSLMLQDRDGQVVEAHSASAGLDYPGIGPQLAALAEGGRIEVASATDREAVAAMQTTTRTEGILPALETAHAIAALPKLLAGTDGSGDPWPDEILVLLGFSGRGDKDLAALERFADVEPWAGERMTTAAPRATGTNDTAGARRIAAAFARARGRRARRADPVHRRGLPGCRDEPPGRRSPPPMPAPTCSRSGCRTRTRSPTAPRSSARPGVALGRGATLEDSLAAHRADRRRPAGPAARPDGLRQPGHRRRRRGGGRAAARGRRRGRPDRRRPDARRGRPVRGGRARRPASRSSTSSRRRPPRRAGPRSPPAAAGSSTASRSSA